MYVGVQLAFTPVLTLVLGWGVAGAALAIGLANLVSVANFARHPIRHSALQSLAPRWSTLRPAIMREVFGIGVSELLQSGFLLVSALVLNHIATSYSQELLAGFGVAQRVVQFPEFLATGVSMGVLPLFGFAADSGGRRPDRCEHRSVQPPDFRPDGWCTVVQNDPLVVASVVQSPGGARALGGHLAVRHQGVRFIGVICADEGADDLTEQLLDELSSALRELIFCASPSLRAVPGDALAARAGEELGIGQDFVFTVPLLGDAVRYAVARVAERTDAWEGTAVLVPGTPQVVAAVLAMFARPDPLGDAR